MQHIAKGCSALLYLNLSYCNVTDSIIRILTKCVSHCRASKAFTTLFPLSFRCMYACVQLFWLAVCEPFYGSFPLHWVFLIGGHSCRYCGSLHYLSLAYSTQFTSKGLQSITTGKGCRRLVYLDLSGCTHLSAEGMHSIGKGCPILNTLILDDIPDFTDAMIIKLVAHCHTLRHISLMGGGSLTDKAFKYLAMENKKLKTIKIESKFSCILYV